MPRQKGSVPPHRGGCWYCHNEDLDLRMSREFDTGIHLQCIKDRLDANPDDQEAEIFAREFSIVFNKPPAHVGNSNHVTG